MKIGLFIPCYINAVYPEVGVASYKLLKSLGLDVDYPQDQTCCGQPMANAGYEKDSRKLALTFEEKFKDYDVMAIRASIWNAIHGTAPRVNSPPTARRLSNIPPSPPRI